MNAWPDSIEYKSVIYNILQLNKITILQTTLLNASRWRVILACHVTESLSLFIGVKLKISQHNIYWFGIWQAGSSNAPFLFFPDLLSPASNANRRDRYLVIYIMQFVPQFYSGNGRDLYAICILSHYLYSMRAGNTYKYIHRWNKFIQVVGCRLFTTNLLPEAALTYCQLAPYVKASVEFLIQQNNKVMIMSFRKITLIWRPKDQCVEQPSMIVLPWSLISWSDIFLGEYSITKWISPNHKAGKS